ncbi:hypothetical protein BDF22DRAFT_681859 [Syncephalis plumigaleata]|nr:hypothetical protein BDF22DRAFT_681859 [Syncephalis plumigaleata]
MLAIDTRPKEPKRLIVVRIIMIILVIGGVLAFAIHQVIKAAFPVYIYQSSEEIGEIPVPTFLIYSLHGVLSDVSIEILREWYKEPTTRALDFSVTSALKRLRWGTDAIYGLESNLQMITFLDQGLPLWSFQPPPDWKYTPSGMLKNPSLNDTQKAFSSLFIKITPNGNATFLNGKVAVSPPIQIVLLENPAALDPVKRGNNLINVKNIGLNTQINAFVGTKQDAYFRYSKRISGDTTSTKYDIQTITTNSDVKSVFVELKPQNTPTSNESMYVYEMFTQKPSFTWFDCFGTVGGALTLSLYIFAFLFGQRRLRPWGIVQRFIFRNRILGKFPSSVVEIGSMHAPRERSATGHDSALGRMDSVAYFRHWQAQQPNQARGNDNNNNADDTQQHTNQSNVAPSVSVLSRDVEPAPYPYNSMAQEHMDLRILINSMIEAKMGDLSKKSSGDMPPEYPSGGSSSSNDIANRRFAELEAFRQRVETFYLADDLFVKRDEPDKNKRSTLQTISELNW